MDHPPPSDVSPRHRTRWEALAAAHPDVVRVHPHGVLVVGVLISLDGAADGPPPELADAAVDASTGFGPLSDELRRPHRPEALPEEMVVFGWCHQEGVELGRVRRVGRPDLVLVVHRSEWFAHLFVLQRDLDAVLDVLTETATSVLARRDETIRLMAGVADVGELESEDVVHLLGVHIEEAFLDALGLGATGYREVPPPPTADARVLVDDPTLARAVEVAGTAWGRDLPPDPSRTLVLDGRGPARSEGTAASSVSAEASVHALLEGQDVSWCAVDPTGEILTWRLDDPVGDGT